MHSVLLLESNTRSRDLHAMILMTHGYDIDCTANASRAWDMWNSKRSEVVLLAMDTCDTRLFSVVERIRHSEPSQIIRLLRPRLCSVAYEGRILRPIMAAEDILAVVKTAFDDLPEASLAAG